MHQLTGDFYSVGMILGHNENDISTQLWISNILNLSQLSMWMHVLIGNRWYLMNMIKLR